MARRSNAAATEQTPDPVRTYGPLTIDTRTRDVRLHRLPVALSPKEYDLLLLLADDPGAVVDRRRILDEVWGPSFFGPGKTLDFHVASLRRKLGDPGWIENRRGVGFRLVAPA
ncbi:winged helix-turn-helix domain-containing protein [Actinoplanes sp. TFC3]|uniref:winged helix-turn-helix domain-containing protein n=1 Tax=Actinoplanes sp. TFC3 TaxID=1710355 RepID=UPI00191C350F|nr:winged helix-turn-helix domain-containing protein [Actinoplanes sp. TFC3]